MSADSPLWGDGQIATETESAMAPLGSDAPPAVKAVIGRSPGQLAWLRLRRDKVAMVSLVGLCAAVLVAVLADLIKVIYGYAPTTTNSGVLDDTGVPLGYLGGITFNTANPSNHIHILGVEPSLGRDLFMQIVYGMRTSLVIAFVSTTMATMIGIVIGIVSGYFGKWIDAIINWFIDYMLAFPFLLFCLAAIPVLNSQFANAANGFSATPAEREWTIIIIFTFFGWMYTARLVRGQVLSMREREYVDAARAAGASVRHILFRQLLPNLWAPILVIYSLSVPTTITAEGALAFLGVGVVEPTPDLGRLINNANEGWLAADPAYIVIPSITIFLMVLMFNLFGDALRDALDPRSSR